MHSCYWCGSTMENKNREYAKRYVLAVGGEVIFTDLTKQEFFYEYEGLRERGVPSEDIEAYQQLKIRKVERYEFTEE